MTRYMSCAETAKIVRKALKEAFPTVKFSVTSKSYSGGASMRVKWIDGPTQKDVEAVTKNFTGADFDPMQDLKTSVTKDYNGEKVRFGADYIFCERSYSVDFLTRRAESVAHKYGLPVAAIKASDYDGHGYVERTYEKVMGGYQTLDELVNKAAQRTRGVY